MFFVPSKSGDFKLCSEKTIEEKSGERIRNCSQFQYENLVNNPNYSKM